MATKVIAGFLAAVVLSIVVMPAFAQEKKDTKDAAVAVAEAANPVARSASYLGLALGFGLALAAFGGALGQSNAIRGAVDAVARQPEAGGRIQGMMIIGLALIETLVIYMLLICFMWGEKVGH